MYEVNKLNIFMDFLIPKKSSQWIVSLYNEYIALSRKGEKCDK